MECDQKCEETKPVSAETLVETKQTAYDRAVDVVIIDDDRTETAQRS
jgi:hypothetical protein